jgi:hypothetical protein
VRCRTDATSGRCRVAGALFVLMTQGLGVEMNLEAAASFANRPSLVIAMVRSLGSRPAEGTRC